MSQQINLLRPKDRTVGAAILAGSVVGIALIGLLGYVQMLRSENKQLGEAVRLGDDRAARVNSAIQALQTRQGEEVALAAEIAVLKPRADALAPLVRSVERGTLGNPQGFARQYTAIAGVAVEGLWITNINVSNAGRALSINGRAMRNESVMQYAQRINEVLAPYSLRFNALELTPEAMSKQPAAAGGAPAAPRLVTVAFKLS